MSTGLGDSERDLLRQMVQQVLHEVVPQSMAAAAPSADEVVVLTNDAELAAFVRRIAVLCDDPADREALRSGSRRFRIAGHAPATADVPAAVPVVRVDKGAVTERHVREAAAASADLVLGRGAVLTPLARDRARASGVRITKEK